MIIVVAALIKKGDKVFIARRKSGDAYSFGKWEFPGGKIEVGETEEHAIEREIFEEFDVKVKALKYLGNDICEYPTKTVDLRLYLCEYVSGDFKLLDHFESAFVDKSELLNYDLAEADEHLVVKYYDII